MNPPTIATGIAPCNIVSLLATAMQHAACTKMFAEELAGDVISFTDEAPATIAPAITLSKSSFEAPRGDALGLDARGRTDFQSDVDMLEAWLDGRRWHLSSSVDAPRYGIERVGTISTRALLARLRPGDEAAGGPRQLSCAALRAIRGEWYELESSSLRALLAVHRRSLPEDVTASLQKALGWQRSGRASTNIFSLLRSVSHLFVAGALLAASRGTQEKALAADLFDIASHELLKIPRFDAAAMAMELSAAVSVGLEPAGLGPLRSSADEPLFESARLWFKSLEEQSWDVASAPQRIFRGLRYAAVVQKWGITESLFEKLAHAEEEAGRPRGAAESLLRMARARVIRREQERQSLGGSDYRDLKETLGKAQAFWARSPSPGDKVHKALAWALTAARQG